MTTRAIRHGLALAAATALIAADAGAAPVIRLPVPGGNPQAIDFATDPVLAFGRTAAPIGPFLAALGNAVAAHPAVQAAIADGAASRAVRTQVRAGLFPQVSAQVTASRALARNFATTTTVIESLTPRGRTDIGLNGSQLLYDFGATGSRIAASDDRIRAAQADVERIAGETELRAVAAYYDVLTFQTLVAISAASVARQREILSDVRVRVTHGVGADGDTARVEAAVADTDAQTARFDRQLGQARARYREAFGANAPPLLARCTPPRSTAVSLDAAATLARRSPSVAVALHLADAARRTARAARADGLPRLSAGLDATRYDAFTGNNDYEVRGTVGLRLNLFAGGRQRGVIEEARAQARSAALAADRIAGESDRDATAAFTDVAALERVTATLETAYIADRRSRDAYVEQFRVSRGSLIELLRAEQSYAQAATSFIQSVVDLDVARYALLLRTGEVLDATGISVAATAL